jgi:hypothetical protein
MLAQPGWAIAIVLTGAAVLIFPDGRRRDQPGTTIMRARFPALLLVQAVRCALSPPVTAKEVPLTIRA